MLRRVFGSIERWRVEGDEFVCLAAMKKSRLVVSIPAKCDERASFVERDDVPLIDVSLSVVCTLASAAASMSHTIPPSSSDF